MKSNSHLSIWCVTKLPVFIFIVLLCSRPEAAEHDIQLSIATTQLPPYIYLDENDEIKGLFVDMLQQAQESSNVKMQFYIMPWARALIEVKANRLDAVMPTLWSKERAEYLVYPNQSFFTFKNSVLIKRTDDKFEFASLSSIGQERAIGKERSVLLDPEFDALVKQGKLRIYETTRLEQALLMLAQKKLDLVASDQGIALSTIKNLGLEGQFSFYGLAKSTPSSFIAFSKGFAKKYNVNYIMNMINTQMQVEIQESD